MWEDLSCLELFIFVLLVVWVLHRFAVVRYCDHQHAFLCFFFLLHLSVVLRLPMFGCASVCWKRFFNIICGKSAVATRVVQCSCGPVTHNVLHF